MLGLFLLIVGALVGYFINLLLGIIMIFFSLIINLINKKKNVFIYIVIALSIITLLVSVVIAATYIVTKKKIYDDADEKLLSIMEERFVMKAQEYVNTKRLEGSQIAPGKIITEKDMNYDMSSCDGYVIYTIGETDKENYQAFVKCGNLTSAGFDETKLK